MRECAPIDQAENPSPPEAPQITPQSPIAQPRDPAALGQRPLLLQDGPNGFVASEGVAIRLCITEEEVQLEHTSRLMRQRFLLPHQQSAKNVREGSYYAQSRPQSDFKDLVPAHRVECSVRSVRNEVDFTTSVSGRRWTDIPCHGLRAGMRLSWELWHTGSCGLGLDQMASMGDHDLVAVTIRVQGGTHLLPYRLTSGLLHGGDLTRIGCPYHGFHNGFR
jgi:hypothetical protein